MHSQLNPSFDAATASFEVPRIAPAAVDIHSVFPSDEIWEGMRLEEPLRVPYDPLSPQAGQSFIQAGPPARLMHDPRDMRVAIVTCGGLCPGLNDVVRGVTLVCTHQFQVKEVLGVRYGYPGIEDGRFVPLDHDKVDNLHYLGGTVLGSARGVGSIEAMVDRLVSWRINMLFCVGGDGTLRGAAALARCVRERGLPISIIGIPKTIDNDIPFVQRSFGVASAVEEARRVLSCAHVEAKGAPYGIGLVKLMGRHAGYVCANATLASGDVNYCLIPEDSFDMAGFLQHLERRMDRREHAVIAVAEGLASQIMPSQGKDASGNDKFGDVGPFLKNAIEEHYRRVRKTINVKYFDPSYSVRSVPANSDDSIFCWNLSRQAVYGAMAGYTEFCVGYWHGYFTYVPLALMHERRKTLSLRSELWHSVLSITGQPRDWR